MKTAIRNLIANFLRLVLSILNSVGITRHWTYSKLPERLQNWLWSLKLPRAITVQHPCGKPIQFFRADESEIYKYYYWKGFDSYEVEATSFVQERANRYSWFVDIGAYIGHFPIAISFANPAISITCYEPVAMIAQALKNNLTANDLNDVKVIEAAVTQSAGEIEFFLPEYSLSQLSSLGSVHNRFSGGAENSERGCQVTVVKSVEAANILNDLPSGLGLVKLDTEGTESVIFTSLKNALEERQPDLIFEVIHPPEGQIEEIEGVLLPLGYRFYLLTSGRPEISSLTNIDPEMLPHQKTNSGAAWGEVLATRSAL